jgi:hypothetical protein
MKLKAWARRANIGCEISRYQGIMGQIFHDTKKLALVSACPQSVSRRGTRASTGQKHRLPACRSHASRLAAIGVLALCLASCHEAPKGQVSSGIVGAWVVKIPDAPFPMHMFVFHSDGTVEQSNPDAGDPNASDSNLMGAWRAVGDEYRGKLVEITADRTTRQFATRGEISFELRSVAIHSTVRQAPRSLTPVGVRSGGLYGSGWKANGCSHDRVWPGAAFPTALRKFPGSVPQPRR